MCEKFLIGQLGRFCDCLYATTIAKQIKHDFPKSHLTWAVYSPFKSILDLNPYVDEIWEIPTEVGDFSEAWYWFEKEAEKAMAKGLFDKAFLTQIHGRNEELFCSTLRNTVFKVYGKPITVDIAPVVRLSPIEVANVKNFAASNKLNNFENVFLFECSPGSGQSQLTVDFALSISEQIAKFHRNVCFILSTSERIDTGNPQIIDGSTLSFRENAELTKYCTHLIGCSSGITWLSTSDWAKRLPMLQLLDFRSTIFAGVHYDFELNGLDFSNVIELTRYDEHDVLNALNSLITKDFAETKEIFHQEYKPGFANLKELTKNLVETQRGKASIYETIDNFVTENRQNGNKISKKHFSLKPYAFFYDLFYRKVKASESGLFYILRKHLKSLLWQK